MYQSCYLRLECLHNQFCVILYIILIILFGYGSLMGGVKIALIYIETALMPIVLCSHPEDTGSPVTHSGHALGEVFSLTCCLKSYLFLHQSLFLAGGMIFPPSSGSLNTFKRHMKTHLFPYLCSLALNLSLSGKNLLWTLPRNVYYKHLLCLFASL